jgi:hypothetical protein
MENKKRLIDANALIKKREEMWQDRCDHMVVRVTNIENAPTVDAVEVVHGRWNIEWEYERDCITGECDENPVATCPFCGHKEWGFAYDEYWGKPYNYCPNCGAKMDGERREGE